MNELERIMDELEELEELERLLDELLNAIQSVILSGEVLTDEFQGVLAKELTYLTDRIDALRAKEQVTLPQEPLPQDEITEAMPSSNVSRFAYNPKKQELVVQFLGKYPNRNGDQYLYKGIPKEVFNIFRQGAVPARTRGRNRWGSWWIGKVPSIGAALYTLLRKGGFSYQKLS